MGVEIEHKYLLNLDKWKAFDKPVPKYLRQGYMVKEPSKTIRVRIADKQAFVTIKGKSTGASRSEFEYEIPLADAEDLLNNFCDSVITKKRFEIRYLGKLWEVDEFLGDNKGLFVAEIELKSEAETYELPDWVDKNVTDDKRYFNSNLLVNPYSTW
jgi:CYTH domain-containing protein